MDSNNSYSHDSRAIPIGHELEGYRIEGILGQGTFGITYLALDSILNRKFAIKEYFPREFAVRDGSVIVKAAGNKEERDTFKWGQERFIEEARVLALFDHPNIVPIRRFFQANGTAYLVMDYCVGTPLDEVIKLNGPLSDDQLNKIVPPVLSALEVIHKFNFIHRDIKPANIFIKSDGSPILLDFGAARQDLVSHSKSVTSIVTEGYGAFEQYSTHGQLGAWTDIYGFSATLYRSLTGERPLDAASRMLRDDLIPLVKKLDGKFDTRFLVAIDAGLSINPQGRPQSIAEWRRMFGFSDSAEPTKKLPSFPSSTRVESPSNNSLLIKKTIDKQRLWFGGVATVVVLGVVAFINVQQGPDSDKNIAVTPTVIPKDTIQVEKGSVPPAQSKVPESKELPKSSGTLPACQGPINNWTNCIGTQTFAVEEGKIVPSYNGEFKNGKANGKGKFVNKEGGVYIGDFKDYLRNGSGTQTTPSGVKYSGGWLNDKFHGMGVFTFANGDQYTGQFADGMFHGKGTYKWVNGQKYVGSYLNDKSSGQGTLTFADGRKYVGEFADGKYNGQGTFYDAQGVKVYSGLWKDGEAKSQNSSSSTPSNYQRCISYVTEAKKGLGLPKKIDSITTYADIYCQDTKGKPTFIYKYFVDSELRIDQSALESLLKDKNKAAACGPQVKMFLPIVDIGFHYFYGPANTNHAPGKLIGKLHYTDADCR